MKLNKNWILFYVKNHNFSGNIKEIFNFDHFGNVSIPTLFELELFYNNILPHPYESTNTWLYQKYEDYHQFYVVNFKGSSKHKFLRLHGVDTIANIYLNGELIGKTHNMFMHYDFELSNLKKNNELIIHVLPAVLEGKKFKFTKEMFAQPYNYESLYLRKCASSFGWDILPRTPLGGIHKDVELLSSLPLIEDLHVSATNISEKYAKLSFSLKLREENPNYKVTFEGKCGRDYFFTYDNKISLKNPKLWNIRGYGKPNLYKITVTVYLDGLVVEKKTIDFGIRKVELHRSSVVQEGGKFEFHINNQKVFLLGSNWVPIEAIKHFDDERMLKALDMVCDLGCNCLRVWGGGVYESDRFYQECNKRGIFVWQDFMMGCGVYPQDKYFKSLIKEEVEYIVPKLRNHPCICLWAGDNENDVAAFYWRPDLRVSPNANTLTRKLIPSLLKKLDIYRPFLPSSPYMDEYAEANYDKYPLAEYHLWGPRDYFKGEFYSNASCYFTSESGYHALNNVESLKKFIKEPWPLFVTHSDNKDDYLPWGGTMLCTKEYLAHATSVIDDYNSQYNYRIRLLTSQVFTLFKDDIDNLEDFVLASQISQAEAKKYFIERMRKDYDRNGGIIWWNLIDGWPQVSDAIVDYYFSKKLAYDYIKKSQTPTLLMMNEDKGDKLNLYVVSSENKEHHIKYEVVDAYKNEVLLKDEAVSIPHSSRILREIEADEKTLLIIKYIDESGNEYINHFHTHIKDLDFNKYIETMKKYKLINR